MSKELVYSFADFLSMKPGTFIEGFLEFPDRNGRLLARTWEGPSTTKIVQVYKESVVEWRNLPKQTVSKTVYHKLSKYPSTFGRTTKHLFHRGQPLGIYLGHLARFDGVFFVNVLTHSCEDVWI